LARALARVDRLCFFALAFMMRGALIHIRQPFFSPQIYTGRRHKRTMKPRSYLSIIQTALCLLVISAALFDPRPCAAQSRGRRSDTAIVALPADKRFPNIGELKTKLTNYHDCQPLVASACYENDLSATISRAKNYLQRRLPRGRKLAMVLDIDETSLSNWEEIKGDDFGFHAKTFNDWIESAKAPAIKPTLELYNLAKQRGVAVFFITGRRESARNVTERNLKAAGYADWDGLVLRPETDKPCDGYANRKETSATVCYKASARKKIADDGYRIVVNIGDQLSDLRGGYAERGYKLPNPFYYLP